jgi:ATP-binding cassette subfamily F protein uup
LCTEILGLDGLGGAHIFADYIQWTAAQRDLRETTAKAATAMAALAKAPREKARRLSYAERRELEDMEARILLAEHAVIVQQEGVETAGRSLDHVRLQECCRALQAAQEAVEMLYSRWQELEAKQRQ